MTVAVLPHLPYSEASARAAYNAGKEVIVHMPMEALNGDLDPGPGAIRTGDSRQMVQDKTTAAFATIPYAVGANNHMGSRITEDYTYMKHFFEAMQQLDSGLFFFDSRTTARSVAAQTAVNMGIPTVERDIFLDNEDNRSAIMAAIEDSKQLAAKRGYAVMIGHVWSNELGKIITELYPELMEEGYRLGTLTELIDNFAEVNR